MARILYRFGRFRLEIDERQLFRGDALVPLPGKAFDTLSMLVEHAGTLLRHQEMIDRLWPDAVVEPNSLQYNISLVRRVLADAVEIQTVRGVGYRLNAEVTRIEAPPGPPPPLSPPLRRPAQRTYFCKASDGTRLAYAKSGEGPPIVKAANWLSHLELDWEGEVWARFLDLIGRGRCLTRYDARGNGLSDWAPPELSFEHFVSDLATIFDAAGVERAPLVGLSQGAAVACAYAARHPARVSALVLIGGCARGWRVKNHAELTKQFEALMVLTRQSWGGRTAAFRQIFTTSFFPDGPPALAAWWNELQRQTTTSDNAAALLSALGDIDVRDELPRVRAPTLVLHSRHDVVVPISDGVELASGIPGAQFVPLESKNHVMVPDEPAWPRYASEIARFLAQESLR